MEYLDLLEKAADTAVAEEGTDNGSVASGSGVSHVLVEGDSMTTPSKRRRRTVLGSVKREAKSTPGKEDVESLVPGLVEVKEEQGPDDGARSCLGCGRTPSSRSWYDDSVVLWANSKGRGRWCKDCNNCWRCVWSHLHTLVFFAKFISTPAGFAEWEPTLFAYLSLQFEETGCIRIGAVHTRVRLLQFLSSLLGWPLRPSVVVPLSEYISKAESFSLADTAIADRLPPMPTDPNSLVNMMTKDGFRLASIVPFNMATVAQRFDRTPEDGEFVHMGSVLGSRKFLATNSQMELHLVRDKFGSALAPEVLPDVMAVEAPQGAAVSKSFSKLNAMVTEHKPLLQLFEGSLWEAVKESRFTPGLAKFAGMMAEARHCGDIVCLRRAEEYCNGFTSGKMFLKGFREYSRSKYKHSKLDGFAKDINLFRSFLMKEGIRPHYRFDLLALKSQFWQCYGEGKSFNDAIKLMFSNGFVDVLSQAKEEHSPDKTDERVPDSFCPGEWFRSISLPVLQFALDPDGFDESAFQEVLTKLVFDIDGVVAQLDASPVCKELLPDARSDLGHFVNILKAALVPPMTRAKLAKEAVEYFDRKQFEEVKRQMAKSDFGKSLVSGCASHIARCARDEVADAKMDRAWAIVNDDRLPSLLQPAHGDVEMGDGFSDILAEARNFGMLTDMSATESLKEGLGLVSEAVDLFSDAAMDEQGAAIVKWLEAVVSNLCLYNELLSLFVHAFLARTEFGKKLFTTIATPTTEDAAVPATVMVSELASMGESMERHMIDESPLESLANEIICFVEGWPEKLQSHGTPAPMGIVVDLKEKVLHDVQVRQCLSDTLLSMCDVGDMPATAEATLDDWISKRAVGQHESSCLSVALKMLERVTKLEQDELSHLHTDTDQPDVQLELQCDDGVQNLVANWSMARNLPALVACSSVASDAKRKLRDCLQLAVDRFADSLCLQVVIVDATAVVDSSFATHDDLSNAISSLYNNSGFRTPVWQSARIFATIGRKDHAWPSESLFTLVVQLCSVWKAGSVNIRTARFSTTGQEGVIATTEDMSMAGKLMMALSHLVQTLAWIHQKFLIKGQDHVVREHRIKSDLECAVGYLKTSVAAELANIEQQKYGDLGRFEEMGIVALVRASTWLGNLAKVVPAICYDIAGTAIRHTAELANEVQGYTPQYGHLITKDRFAESAAKKALLHWPHQDVLGIKVVQLFHLIADVHRVWTSWALTPLLTEDPANKDDMAMAQDVLDTGKVALSVLAGVRVLFELIGKEQQNGATQLLAKARSSLPGGLVAKLSKYEVVQKAVPAKDSDDTT